MKATWRVLGAMSVILALSAGSVQAGLLGTSPNYNVFAFGDYQQQYVDVTGRLAVKGNATLTGFGVGSALSVSGGASLVVGGDLNYTNGQVSHGDVRVGGKASVQGFGLPQGKLYYNAAGNPAPPNWVPQQQVAGGGIASDFFSSAETYANALSQTLAETAATGIVAINPQGKITLTASGSGLTVFNLTAAQLAGASSQGINLSANSSATVVVNVLGTGSAVSVSNFAFGLSGGISASKIVYNFRDVTTLNTTNISWQSSILAPKTVFSGTYGNVDGDLAVASVRGSTEFHDVPFLGVLPNPVTAVPEPTTMAGALLGLITVVVGRRMKLVGPTGSRV